MGTGPLWKLTMQESVDNCKKNWWQDLLFINNFTPPGSEGCLGHLWYLANDMQFFVITPFILWCYCKMRNGYCIPLTVLFVAASVTVGVLTYQNDLPSNTMIGQNAQHYSAQLYIKPWGRILPYLIGIVVGTSYFEYASKNKHPEFQHSLWVRMYHALEVSTPCW